MGITLSWEGKGINEIAKIKKIEKFSDNLKVGDIIVRVDERYYRPSEVETLLGDPSKAAIELGWEPKITLEELIEEMIVFDREEAQREVFLKKSGYVVNSSRENPP